MKKTIVSLILLVSLGLSGCGKSSSSQPNSIQEVEQSTKESVSNTQETKEISKSEKQDSNSGIIGVSIPNVMQDTVKITDWKVIPPNTMKKFGEKTAIVFYGTYEKKDATTDADLKGTLTTAFITKQGKKVLSARDFTGYFGEVFAPNEVSPDENQGIQNPTFDSGFILDDSNEPVIIESKETGAKEKLDITDKSRWYTGEDF